MPRKEITTNREASADSRDSASESGALSTANKTTAKSKGRSHSEERQERHQGDKPQKPQQANERHYYKVNGLLKLRVTMPESLKQRLENYFENSPPQVNQSDEKQGEEDKPESQQDDREMKRRKFRYYDKIEQYTGEGNPRKIKRVCGKCGDKGHTTRECFVQMIKCYNCLGEHTTRECPGESCRRCGETGHYSLHCKKQGVKCFKCGMVGHKDKDCGRVILEQDIRVNSQEFVRERQEDFYREDMKNVRCFLNCERWQGHPFCDYDLAQIASESEEEGEIIEGKKADIVYQGYWKSEKKQMSKSNGSSRKLW